MGPYFLRGPKNGSLFLKRTQEWVLILEEDPRMGPYF